MDHQAILQDYLALREHAIPLSTKLVKLLSSEEIGLAAQQLGVLEDGKTITLETSGELVVVMDYAIHELRRPDGRNAIDRLLQDDPPPEGSPALRLAQSMAQSRYTTLRPTETIPGVGFYALDLATVSEIFLVDVGMSSVAQQNSAVFLASPLTVAASALTGHVTDPREYVSGPIETGVAGVK